jgi:hypothetical protein
VLVEQVQSHSAVLSSSRAVTAATPVVIPQSAIEGAKFDPGTKSCLKKSSVSSRRTAAQLEFIVFMHKQGEDNKEKKVTGEKAREAMQLKGTVKGEKLFPNDLYMAANPDERPAFKMIEWLDVGQIKAYLSQPHAELVRQLKVLQDKERERINRLARGPANPHPRLTEAAINQMLVSDLKEALTVRGAKVSGRKADLVARLLAVEAELDGEGDEEDDEGDEVLIMGQCTCNGTYESDEVTLYRLQHFIS